MVEFIVIAIIGTMYFFWRRASLQKMVCRDCGFAGPIMDRRKGSLLVEIALWCCFLVPGFIYSIWRMSSTAYQCPTCSGWNLIPASSPAGARLLQDGLRHEEARAKASGEK